MSSRKLTEKNYEEAVKFMEKQVERWGMNDTIHTIWSTDVVKYESELVRDRFLGLHNNGSFHVSKEAHLIALLMSNNLHKDEILDMTCEEGITYIYLFGR